MYASADQYALSYGASEAAELEGRDDGRLQAALDSASAEADSYLATRYQTPVAAPGPVLAQAVLDIARFRLWDARAPEEVRERYKTAIAWLRHIAAGQALLTEGAPKAAGASASVAASARTLVYAGAFEARYTPPGV
jgi:phage gp36-like protein